MAGLWLAVHLVAGGAQVVRPLRASTDLDPVVRDTQYLCWHFTSAALAAIAAFFLIAAWFGSAAFAGAGVILSAAIAVTGLVLTPLIGQSYASLPQGWLFVPVGLLGAAGAVL